jgi:hypothetical protein
MLRLELKLYCKYALFNIRNHTMGKYTSWKQLVQRAQQLKVHKHEISGHGCFGTIEFLDFKTYENYELDCFCLACAGIFKQSMGARNLVGSWDPGILGSLKVQKYRLWDSIYVTCYM